MRPVPSDSASFETENMIIMFRIECCVIEVRPLAFSANAVVITMNGVQLNMTRVSFHPKYNGNAMHITNEASKCAKIAIFSEMPSFIFSKLLNNRKLA